MNDSARPQPLPGNTAEKPGESIVVLRQHPAASEPSTLPTRSTPFKIRVMTAVGLVICASCGVLAYRYWTVGQYLETTDDAYVKTDLTAVAPKVSGYISEVLVSDNDRVEAGQVLARIDDRDYQNALLQARADVTAANAAIANIDAQIELQQSFIAQAEAAEDASQASLTYAESDASRTQRLIEKGVGTVARAEQSQSVRDQAYAAVKRDQAARLATEAKLPVLQTQREQAIAQRQRAAAALAQAELNLSHTRILAPIDGTVGARTIRLGQLVAAGTQTMVVVPLHAIYVIANFKETQLTYLRVGQPVTISVDSFPDQPVKGHIDSISPGSGSEFSLLPSDNATGNFTKVVQRVPVKIEIDQDLPLGHLRAGMSVVPTVNIREGLQH
ncbi:MAG: HlyD family secretion protein [Pseudorhizobium pelagicum]|uniref:HlyD family secretion protein n=1 Tax=Pseudorhizobium pelagicum TaxID=1509405 RepID=UPI0034601948